MRSNTFRGPFEGMGPEMATSEASAIWAQKSREGALPPPPHPCTHTALRIRTEQ
jgi:hypothetical protein